MVRPLPPIALLTDFGASDAYVGVMKGVILGVHADARVVDLCHEVPPQDVERGATLLAEAWSWFPPGTLFVAVVDPGVGSERRALVARIAGRLFVGPDNGLCSRVDPGRTEARSIPEHWGLGDPRARSRTFHGRDVFAPAAARLAAGLVRFDDAEPLATPLVRLPDRPPGRVADKDRFGNLITDLPGMDHGFVLWRERRVPVVRTYAEGRALHGSGPDGLVALTGSAGVLELAVPGGSAWIITGARVGEPVSWEPG